MQVEVEMQVPTVVDVHIHTHTLTNTHIKPSLPPYVCDSGRDTHNTHVTDSLHTLIQDAATRGVSVSAGETHRVSVSVVESHSEMSFRDLVRTY
jgi:hypothetical protein